MFSFNLNQLMDVRKTFGYTDVNKLKQDIDILDDWIRKQNHFTVKEFDRDYLERYLIYNKGSIERAKHRFDQLCTLKNLMPEFLRGFDIKNEFEHLFNTVHICFLPKPTPDNYRVGVVKIHGNDEFVQLIHLYRYFVVMCEYVLTHDYCAGYEIIGDTRDMAWGLVTKLNPIIIQKAVTLLVEAMGQRIKKMHFISGSTFLDTVISILKQGMTAKLSKRIYVHDSCETLYDHIPKEILPQEYGGNEKSLIEIKEMNFEEVSTDKHIERIKLMEKVATDESRRSTWKFTEEYSGMPGSFKTLTVD